MAAGLAMLPRTDHWQRRDRMSDINESAEGEEYEEITSDEVDRVVEELEKLTATIESENIRVILENASNDIWYLVYEDEDAAEAA
jgi:hypothetical protein